LFQRKPETYIYTDFLSESSSESRAVAINPRTITTALVHISQSPASTINPIAPQHLKLALHQKIVMISSANSASIHALIQIKMDMPEPPSRLPSASLGPHIPVDFDPTSSISTTQISASRKRRSTHAMSSEDRRKFRRVHDISTHKEGYTPCPSSSLQKPKCKIIRMSDGTILESRPIEACPDVPTLGDEPKRDETGSTIPNTKNEAEAKSELKWQKARKR
jgi:hypothetical protein